MGLTKASMGKAARERAVKNIHGGFTVALAGNPNVGKSTLFNALTGMKQHTGNWSGKTVMSAVGCFEADGEQVTLVDLPGTYSLLSHSEEERIARDYICFGNADLTVVVCDATAPHKSIGLALQILEITPCVIVCFNLIDEARKKHIELDTQKFSDCLGVPVIAMSASTGEGVNVLCDEIIRMHKAKNAKDITPVYYSEDIEKALSFLKKEAKGRNIKADRSYLIRLLLDERDYLKQANKISQADDEAVSRLYEMRDSYVSGHYGNMQLISDSIVASIIKTGREICSKCCIDKNRDDSFDRKLDRLFTGRFTGIPIMLAVLILILFITIKAANYPSQLLSSALFFVGEKLRILLETINTPNVLISALIDGIWRVLAWVVSVMLPPMAVFFPLFTLLEDFGYLPRVAFNLDSCMKKCGACGKQSLCMAMGLGCNAAGVTGCRIIDSPRERLLAIATNSFIPCNGRFPLLITLISIFFASGTAGSIKGALLLCGAIVFGIVCSMAATKLLSKTVLKGSTASFTLELPSYRIPKVTSVLVRSLVDRTLFVLGRAVTVAAPAGLVIWLAANIEIGGVSIVSALSAVLDPIGRIMGLDGTILLAFMLGFPANEIVFPIAVMIYMAADTVQQLPDLASLGAILTQNGWTYTTALCMIIFTLMHWPCSTTCLTVKKETGSIKWTLISILLPTAFGFVLCCAVNFISGALSAVF